MPIFDPDNPILISAAKASLQIRSGWIAQFRGVGYLSRLIQNGTGSIHTHSGMFHREPHAHTFYGSETGPRIDLAELREFHGGRRKSLAYHAFHNPGQIDVFAANARYRWGFTRDSGCEWDGEAAASKMIELADKSYGYVGVFKLALRKIPGFWRLFPITTSDIDPETQLPFCSHAVSLATKAGGVDPVPNCPDYLVTPGMLTRSLFYEYQFTIGGLE